MRKHRKLERARDTIIGSVEIGLILQVKHIVLRICRDWANFTSKAYSSYAAAGAAADAHVAKYPAHADKVSVFYCEKSSCQ